MSAQRFSEGHEWARMESAMVIGAGVLALAAVYGWPGQALVEKGGVPVSAGDFFDGEPCCYGRPSEARLRREIAQRL